jgi:hypothetical protein
LFIDISTGWSIKQIGVSNTFLHGFLQESVYMVQPPGFIDSQNTSIVCHLKKAIYGLKQAPGAWFQRLSTKLLELGFHGSTLDISLFIYNSGGVRLFILVYVDDIIITGFSNNAIDSLIQTHSATFPIKDLG